MDIRNFSYGGFIPRVCERDPSDSVALLSNMAIALAAHTLVYPTPCSPWRGASQVRSGAELVSALVPVSSSCSRFGRVQAAGKLAFGRGKW